MQPKKDDKLLMYISFVRVNCFKMACCLFGVLKIREVVPTWKMKRTLNLINNFNCYEYFVSHCQTKRLSQNLCWVVELPVDFCLVDCSVHLKKWCNVIFTIHKKTLTFLLMIIMHSTIYFSKIIIIFSYSIINNTIIQVLAKNARKFKCKAGYSSRRYWIPNHRDRVHVDLFRFRAESSCCIYEALKR